MAQQFSAIVSLRRDLGDLGSSPTSGSLHGPAFPSASLSLSLPLMHKEIKYLIKKRREKQEPGQES